VGRRLVHLTPKEFALLWTLATSPGKVFRREELLQEVWGNVHVTVRTVDTHMAKLRGKLRTAPDGRDLAETVWGVGYRLRNASS
jgi:two-component system response regulator ResD